MFGIKGLLYLPDYISRPHHDRLIRTIDARPWRTELSRRTQHYGYVYDYRARTVDRSMWLGELPGWLQRIAVHLHNDGRVPEVPDQTVINEYEPGQGIADHIDCSPCFGDAIVSLSLGSAVVMDLKREGQSVPVVLEPRSLLVLQDQARFDWTHGIARRKQDTVDGVSVERKRRLSVTFRRVVVPEAAR
jgi:alkylated DNA repair dioxygenase AlkB